MCIRDRYGAELCLCDISADALSAARTHFPNALLIQADVSDSAQIQQLFRNFGTHFDRLDVLVNNAGISGPTKPAEEITDEEWATTMNVNISGMFYMIRGAIPLFRKAQGGCVINMSSVAGRVGMPLRLPYSVSKFAVCGLTKTLAIELGEIGVRVNSILPGLVDGPRGQ